MKAAGKYRSIIKGVSQQAPALRTVGQMTEQINLSPDPVEGLSRRFPTQYQSEQLVDSTGASFADMTTDTANWRTFDYFSEGVDYTLCIRRVAAVSTALPVMTVYDRTNKQFLTLHRNVTDTNLDALVSGGVSAVANIGKYVFFAGNTIVPTVSEEDVWSSNLNLSEAVVWIRGGAFAREFTVTATPLSGSPVTFSYTTPTASYPYDLDTTGVPIFIPNGVGASGSVPNYALALENISRPVTSGGTYTLVHAAAAPVSIMVNLSEAGGIQNNADAMTLVAGLDYTIAAGVITWLDGPEIADINGVVRSRAYGATLINNFGNGSSVTFSVLYQWDQTGGATGTTFATAVTSEALFVQIANGFGTSELNWKDWNPQSMQVLFNTTVMTNVYPAMPANPNQYSWEAGAPNVVFDPSLVNSLHVTAIYTHTDVVPNPSYSKEVNDITNAYNTAVTSWIGSSAAAIEPTAIAQSLANAATTAGISGVTVQGSTIIFDTIKSLVVDDGGDGTLIRGVADAVATVDQVSLIHAVGKVVKVRGATSKESFYLRATAKDPSVLSGYTEVIWVEGAGVLYTLDAKFIYGTAVGTSFYLAGSAAGLATLTSFTDVPDYVVNQSGDGDTNPVPYFVGRQITYLGIFQDRLLVGCGGVIRASQIANYLTFFRTTVLALPNDDAMEFLSQGAADDVLRYSVLYDQNLVFFGLKRQYRIAGNQPMTPTNTNMTPMSSHQDAAEMPPLVAGDFIFYGKKGPHSSSVYQMVPGQNTNSPASYIISSQIDLYLQGDAIEFASMAKPTILFLRTASSRSSLYLFSYYDTQSGRLQDAWHRWDYNPAAGIIIGMQPTSEGLVILSLRRVGNNTYVVADLQATTSGLSDTPYLDSQRTVADLTVHTTGSLNLSTPNVEVAMGTTSQYQFLGDELSQYARFTTGNPGVVGLEADQWVGWPTTATITPTNPFARNSPTSTNAGDAITQGRLTIANLLVGFSDTSGYVYTVSAFGSSETTTFNGRLLGDPTNLIGREPVTTFQKQIVIGRETRDYRLDLSSRKWFPFTITSIDWVGQYFNRTQQV